MSKFISIDIETTGLNPKKCQIIEFGAIIDDLKEQKPYKELPKFVAHIWRPYYKGEPYALNMHSNFFKRISQKDSNMNIVTENELMPLFKKFILDNGYKENESINVAGKNFAGFDKKFIDKLKYKEIKFSHRVLDPAILYFDPNEDDVLPNMKTCLERAEMSDEVPHTALEDAWLVCKLLRYKFSKTT